MYLFLFLFFYLQFSLFFHPSVMSQVLPDKEASVLTKKNKSLLGQETMWGFFTI